MAKTVSTKPPSGFRDFLGEASKARSSLQHKIEMLYRSRGFESLETPALENLEVLLGSGGQENEKLIFKSLKRGEKLQRVLEKNVSEADTARENDLADMGLRFDLTVPLCRAVAEYQSEITLPWKVFHMGPVWRAERPQRGRFREFVQCDVDIIGSSSYAAELEVMGALGGAFEVCGLSGLRLRYSHRKLLEALSKQWGFGDKLSEFAIVLDKKDKMPLEKLFVELRELRGENLSSDLEKALCENWSLEEALSSLKSLSSEEKLVFSDFESFSKNLEENSLSEFARFEFDLSLVRGMGYYTGCVFEIMHPTESFALGGGGRYDELTGRFMKKALPAVGGSLGFERLLLLLESQMKGAEFQEGLFVCVFEEALRPSLLKIAKDLRGQGVSVDIYADEAKLKSQLKYASQKKYRWVLIAGPEELAKSKVSLKDLTSSEEESYSLDEASLSKLAKKVLADK